MSARFDVVSFGVDVMVVLDVFEIEILCSVTSTTKMWHSTVTYSMLDNIARMRVSTKASYHCSDNKGRVFSANEHAMPHETELEYSHSYSARVLSSDDGCRQIASS